MPLKDLEKEPEKFVEFIDQFTWRGHTVVRKCADSDCSESSGSTAKATIIRIEAIEGANALKFDEIPANGYVIGRMINLGEWKEKLYEIPPRSGEWYVVATPKNGNEANIEFANLTLDPDGKPKLKAHKGPSLRVCKNESQASQADADFRGCTNADHGRAHSFDKGAWFTCSLGCCTADSDRPPPKQGTPADSVRADSLKGRDSTARPRP